MKNIFLFCIICLCSHISAQVNNDLIIEQIERMSENSGEENVDYSELTEAYWNMIDNPININSDDIEQLAEFMFISVFQLEKIKEYKNNYGDFKFIDELYEIDGLDEKSIDMIKPLICFNDNKEKKIRISDIFRYGKNRILMEINQCLNKKEGYYGIDDSLLCQKPNSIYLGNSQKIYLRYNYTYNNKIETGFVLEKDPGEYILKKNLNDSIIKLLGKQAYSGFDFFSFHIYIQNFGFLKTLAIGDYKISFGQGLTMGSGMAFTADGGNLLRKSKKISASKSANEAYYLRGLASTFKYRNHELSVFYSNKKTDANITLYDSISEIPIEISSLQQSGLHRTYNEIMDRKVIRQQLYGFNFSYKKSNFQIGYTLHKTDLNADLSPENDIYNIFYFRGKNIINQGLDFYYILQNMLLYGEIAMSDNKGKAGLIGACIQPTGYIEFTILYRNYAKDYQSLYGNAYASGSNNRNEKGWYLSSVTSIAANWRFICSIDFYESDWLKSTAYSPSHGYTFNSKLNYQPDNNTIIFISYRNNNKMKNTSRDDIFQKFLTEDNNNMIRFHIAYQINDKLSLKNRVEYHYNKNEQGKSSSYLIYQDILYNNNFRCYNNEISTNLAFRYELFNAEKGSVYAYENDVLYAFAIGGLSGKGIRTYLVGKLKFLNQIQISGKLGFTFYSNKTEIGSGLETIYNNWKGDVKLQLVWSF